MGRMAMQPVHVASGWSEWGSRGGQRAQGDFGSYLILLTATSSAWDVVAA